MLLEWFNLFVLEVETKVERLPKGVEYCFSETFEQSGKSNRFMRRKSESSETKERE